MKGGRITESKNPKVEKAKNARIMLLSKCAVFESEKSKVIKQQEASGIVSSLRIKAPLNKVSLLSPLLF